MTEANRCTDVAGLGEELSHINTDQSADTSVLPAADSLVAPAPLRVCLYNRLLPACPSSSQTWSLKAAES